MMNGVVEKSDIGVEGITHKTQGRLGDNKTVLIAER